MLAILRTVHILLRVYVHVLPYPPCVFEVFMQVYDLKAFVEMSITTKFTLHETTFAPLPPPLFHLRTLTGELTVGVRVISWRQC